MCKKNLWKSLWNGLFAKKNSSISAVTEKPNVPTVTMEEDVPEVNDHGISAVTEEPDNSTIKFRSFEEAKPYLIQQLKKILEKTRKQPDSFSEIRENLTNHVADMIQTTTKIKPTKYPIEITTKYEKELVELLREIHEQTGFIVLQVRGQDGLLNLGFLIGDRAYGVHWKEYSAH